MAPGADEWSVPRLRQRCTDLREALLAREAATLAELDAILPGGAENEERGKSGWTICYGQLIGFHYRENARTDGLGREDAWQRALSALAREPITIPLLSPPADAPATLTVHHKGALALLECGRLDWLLGWFAATIKVLEERGRPRGFREAVVGRSHTLGLLVWIITHPGPELPYPDYTDAPDPPRWMRHLQPEAMTLLVVAHQRMNGAALEALRLLTTEEGGERLEWAGYFAQAAHHRGVDVYRLMRDQSLLGLLVQDGLAGEVERRAADAAKRRATGGR